MKKLFIPIVYFFIAAVSFAQENLEITVSDLSNQAPLSGVIVHLENSLIGYQAAMQTNSQGKVQFKGLSTSGIYTAFVEESERYFEAKAENILVRSNKKPSVTLALAQKENKTEEVTVEGTATTKINTID